MAAFRSTAMTTSRPGEAACWNRRWQCGQEAMWAHSSAVHLSILKTPDHNREGSRQAEEPTSAAVRSISFMGWFLALFGRDANSGEELAKLFLRPQIPRRGPLLGAPGLLAKPRRQSPLVAHRARHEVVQQDDLLMIRRQFGER